MPSFAGRLSDRDIADLANYVRTSWGNAAAPNASEKMVAAWRETVPVPDYGTQAASAFDCGQVGGAPGVSGPDPKAVAALSETLRSGNRDIPSMIDSYEDAEPSASPAEVVDALMAAYCPVVAASASETYQKKAELRRFALQAAADVSPKAATVQFPPVSVIWAVAAGHSLVAREPETLSGALACPKDDGKLVPADLVAKAAALIGKPTLPVSGDAATKYANALATTNPKARLADIANALILTYCGEVAANTSLEPAQQHGWLEQFGEQAIETLQLRN